MVKNDSISSFAKHAKLSVAVATFAAMFLVTGPSAFAQQPDPQAPPPPDQSQAAPPPQDQSTAPQDPGANSQQQQDPSDQQNLPPADQGGPQTGAPPPQDQPMPPRPLRPQYNAPPRRVPDALTIPQGTVIQIRTSDWLSSDKNKKGDQFIGTLANPVIVNGWVIARRGQTIVGQVTIAQKAGRVKGVSQLQLDLNQLTLVDGQLLTVQTSLLNASAGTSKGRDAGAIVGTTATGAAIGGIAGGGVGAGIGAGAGFVASVAGVLLTRGKPTIIPPEDVLTFRVEAPTNISTTYGPYAFRVATAQDYAPAQSRRPRTVVRPYPAPYGYYPYGPAFGYYPPPVAIGYGYPYGGYYRAGWGWGW